ncbi:FMN-dependent NADH-azoreductase [Clostridium ihumii]|uniref:FMN-dependent NADH-azoreductase n=1 Tax=Clostridium ihumii TaxID=1470356 RepID=UPI003D33F41D
MKKLLYITVNSKPEELSASKTVGRAFVNKFLDCHDDFELQELDLYEAHIPRLEYQYFEKRNCLLNDYDLKKLDEKEQKEVRKIIALCNQFKDADVYVIAAPMWSLSFPAPLKEYIDCVIQDGKTIKITQDKVDGLLNDKDRTMIYIQSSGASIPWILKKALNKGLNYVEDIMKFMGIEHFKEILVDGTGFTEEEKNKAIEESLEKVTKIAEEIKA